MTIKIPFAVSGLFITLISMILLVLLSKHTTYINTTNQLTFGKLLLVLFAFTFIVLFIRAILIPNLKLLKNKSEIALLLALVSLPILAILDKQIGIYATAFLLLNALISLLINKKFYTLNPIYYLLFTYPVLEFFGTIGSSRGFHFPDMTLSFYLIPIAFCCFRIEKKMLLQILKVIFRITLVFMLISIVNWCYSILNSDVTFFDWISKKVFIDGVSAYKFVTSWSYYNHPSYINLVLLPVLLSGFYVYYKKEATSFVSKPELTIFIITCVFLQLIMESRIGLVGVSVILLVTGFYYLHIRKIFFKIALFTIIILGSIGFVVFDNAASNFVNDPVRKTDFALATHYIKNNLWWGAGYYEEANVLRQQEKELEGILEKVNQPKTYTHNQLLGTMIQFGIPGALVVVLVMVGLLWYAFRTRSYLLQLYICLYILFMQIEEPFYVQEGITRFMVFLSLFIHIIESEKKIKSYTLFNRLAES